MNKCWKKKLFNERFTVSACKFDGVKKQGIHVLIHLGLELVFLGFVGAFGFEIWDGFKKVNREGRPAEGFNFFPDLTFRLLGAAAGWFLRGQILSFLGTLLWQS